MVSLVYTSVINAKDGKGAMLINKYTCINNNITHAEIFFYMTEQTKIQIASKLLYKNLRKKTKSIPQT